MKPAIYIRATSPQENSALEGGLRSREAFTLRRCQILLASAKRLTPRQIARQLNCADQTVRNAIKAFNEKGLVALTAGSSRPKTVQPLLSEADLQALKAILHQSPRTFGKNTSLWTLNLVAQVCFEQGLTSHQVSDETIRQALKRLKVGWKRAKHWITSPDPDYLLKKSVVTA
jgi:transposase